MAAMNQTTVLQCAAELMGSSEILASLEDVLHSVPKQGSIR